MDEHSVKFAEPPPSPLRRFTVEEYHRLGEFGVLRQDDRVELLEGWIVEKMIHNPRHDATVAHDAKTIGANIPVGWHLRIQSAITTADSEPEPDLAVVRGTELDYIQGHPRSSDIALLVEVSDASLARDRGIKSRLYARERIAIYWLVNLVDGQVEVYTDPVQESEGSRYARRTDFSRGDTIPLIVAGREVARIEASDLLGS